MLFSFCFSLNWEDLVGFFLNDEQALRLSFVSSEYDESLTFFLHVSKATLKHGLNIYLS